MKAKIYNYKNWIKETNPEYLKIEFKKILEKSGFKIIDNIEYYFTPFGYTALFLLAESHFAIHTFPEENKTYIELSSCVKSQFDKFIKEI